MIPDRLYSDARVEQPPLFQDSLPKKPFIVLIVDDAEADRKTYRRYIKSAANATMIFVEAEDGEYGLTLCQQLRPNLILLDYRLPDIDGLEFLQALENQMSSVPPVIMLTGEGNEQAAVAAMKLGARDYLVKGELSATSLSQAIQRIISQQALQALTSRQEREQKLLTTVSRRIGQADSLPNIMNAIVTGARELLACDRLLIYRFEPDLSGTIVAKSVLPRWSATLPAHIEDTCFKSAGVERYEQGYVAAITNVAKADLSPCHAKMLADYDVKANLAVPILVYDSKTREPGATRKVWGLLIAHSCQMTRAWQEDELALLDSLAVQLAIAIRQADLVFQVDIYKQDLDELVGLASGALRAPVRAVTNLSSWLDEDILFQNPAESKEQLRFLRSKAHQIDEYITGLLDYSRAGSGSSIATWVSTQTLLDEVIACIETPPGFKVTAEADAVPALHAHKMLLQQVLSNIIGNAIKHHNRSEGQVTVTAIDSGQMMRFLVIDDGPGIDPSYHNSIFHMFRSFNSQGAVAGTGIGLSIVKKIVERQGGQVMICSAIGEGSTFSFTWPKQ